MTRLVVLFSAFLFILSPISSQSFAQSCDIYEAEMKSYFDKYSPNSRNYSRVMESYWAKCPNPTPAMNLIYFYAKSNFYLNIYKGNRYKESAYENARDNYYLAANNFKILRVKRFNGEPFWEKLNERYEKIESSLASSDPYRRYKNEQFRPKLESEESSSGFAKSNWRLNLSRGTSRAAENPNRKSFEKKYRYKDGYVAELPKEKATDPSRDEDAGDEEYGFVGEVEKLTLMDYLDWLSKNKEKGDDLVYYDATGWVTKLGEDFEVLVNGFDSLIVRDIPGAKGKRVGMVRFGDAMAKYAKVETVYRNDVTYVKVKMESGRDGWVPQIATIPDGALATIIEPLVATVSPGSRLDRGRFILSAADLVILSQEKGDYIQVVTKDMKSVGWIDANKGWSIIYDDVVIATMYQEAMKVPYLVERLKELEAITFYDGFEDSPLADLVLKEIESLK